MYKDNFWIIACFLSLDCVTISGFSAVERYEVVIYQKIETRNSSLRCLFCFNGDNTNDCMTLTNISNIPTTTCKINEPHCKVRQLSKDGKLVTFDRHCASHCEPGCRDAASYSECVSCCNKPQCNVDTFSSSCQWPERWHFVMLIVVFIQCLTHP